MWNMSSLGMAGNTVTANTLTSRRWFLQECGVGLGKVALASLLTGAFASRAPGAATATEADLNQNPLSPRASHYPARAKAAIHLFMAGAPSQLDLFDNKPVL